MTHRYAPSAAAMGVGALTVGAMALAACAPAAPPGQPAPPPPGQTPGEPERPMQDCQALDTRNWEAWVNRMPGPGGGAGALHVAGEAQYRTAGWGAALQVDRVLETAPPVLVLQLIETPPDGMAAQVLTWEEVRFEMEADPQGYSAVQIECGPEAIAEISPVEPVY